MNNADQNTVEDFEIIDGEKADDIVAATLSAHRHNAADGTECLVVRKTPGVDGNPRRRYLLLLDA
jgi:hypothetical protein